MNVLRTLTIVALCAGLLAACSKSVPDAPSAVQAVSLQQEWIPYSGYAGEVAASRRFAAKNGLQLTVVAGSEQVDPIKLVLAGTAKFGVVGGDLLVAAIAKGAPLVAIGVVNEQSPTVFLVDAQSPIRTPRDFVGQKVGILPGTNTERIYQLMMQRAGIDRATVQEIPVPFDLQTFLLKQYAVRPAFIFDEPVSLEQKKVAYRIIKPEGVAFLGTVYFTTRDTLTRERPTVVRLLKSLVQGWQFALHAPNEAVADLAASFPEIDRARESRALELGQPYFVGAAGKPLQCNDAAWTTMISGLEELKVIAPKSVTLDQVWAPAALQDAYRELALESKP